MTATMDRRRFVGIATQLLVAAIAIAVTALFSCVLLQQHPQSSVTRPSGQAPPAATSPP
ncbi:hypothetical protein [Nocardia sp. BMG51109]|uniref:hypothetical protein n=1 Tax=Nocardia sp. BMG51109 TaxID=1056816 RepID=UPI0004B7997B|nr:hypothetical protein [Nocardia sp. BMG51109]